MMKQLLRADGEPEAAEPASSSLSSSWSLRAAALALIPGPVGTLPLPNLAFNFMALRYCQCESSLDNVVIGKT